MSMAALAWPYWGATAPAKLPYCGFWPGCRKPAQRRVDHDGKRRARRGHAPDESACWGTASGCMRSFPPMKICGYSRGSTGFPIRARGSSEWLERTGLDRVSDGLVREFSRGMRQRLAVARAFLHKPSLLLLDEPFTALDDRAIKVLQDLLESRARRGRTIIMSTHQLREALELATDVALINRGRLGFPRPANPRNVGRSGLAVSSLRRGMNFLRQAWAVAAKDLRSEVRSKETVNASLSFALVILLLFSFAFDPDAEQVRADLGRPALAGLRLRRHVDPEPQLRPRAVNDCLDALIASPATRRANILRQMRRELRSAGRSGDASACRFSRFFTMSRCPNASRSCSSSCCSAPGESR